MNRKIIIFFNFSRLLTYSQEIKNLWIFANNLETKEEMLNNSQLNYHANKIIFTLEKIILLSDSSAISVKDKEHLVTLGKNHYHYGLKKEYFKVN